MTEEHPEYKTGNPKVGEWEYSIRITVPTNSGRPGFAKKWYVIRSRDVQGGEPQREVLIESHYLSRDEKKLEADVLRTLAILTSPTTKPLVHLLQQQLDKAAGE